MRYVATCVNDTHEVDTTDLVDELSSVGEQDATTGLDLVALENLRPFVFAVDPFDFQGFEDIALLFSILRRFGGAIVDLAQHLECLLRPAFLVQVSWALWNPKDHEDDNLRQY